ncbi:MAG: arginase family protein [Terriglobales bacterium]
MPYDSGQKNVRMGAGPGRLMARGLGSLSDVTIDQIEVEEFAFELGTTFRVLRALAEKVTVAVQSNRFPLILAGGCLSCVGTLAGVGAESAAIVWLDAHGDFNTPETTVSGFLDGMALAAASGRCWQNLTSSVPGFRPVREQDVLLIGARDLDPEERALLENSAITAIDTATIRKRGAKGALCRALDALSADRIYLHVDLDVLDLSEARVNQFSSTGGLTLAELLETVREVVVARPVAAAAITAYDPSYDEDGRALRAGTALVMELIGSNRDSFARANA